MTDLQAQAALAALAGDPLPWLQPGAKFWLDHKLYGDGVVCATRRRGVVVGRRYETVEVRVTYGAGDAAYTRVYDLEAPPVAWGAIIFTPREDEA